MDQLDRDFDALLAQYRQATGEPEPSANFMPRLWRKIETKRTVAFRFRRLTQVFVGAAAVLCLLIASVGMVLPGQGPQVRGSYLDALAEAHPTESLAALGIVHGEAGEANH